MSAVAEITDALIAGGMTPGAAAMLVARAAVELSPSLARSRGAERMADYRDRREAMGLPRIFPAKQYQAPLEARDGHQCIYCRATDGLVIDHIEALFLGGTDDLGNLGFACRPCNGGKAGKSLADAGMQITVESAHSAHKSYLDARASTVNSVRTDAHTSKHVRAPSISILPSSSLKDEIKEGRKLEGARTRKASRLPDDWQPSKDDIDYALGKGLRFDRICTVGEKFKNHWLAKAGKGATALDWHRKWCTWVLNEIEWNGGSNGRGPTQARTGGFASNRLDHAFGQAGTGDADYIEGEPSTDFRPRH